MRYKGIFAAFVATLLFSLSPLAADPVIERGIDVFTTTANGKTFYNFAANPIPAGFFCKRSAAFTGRVALKGLPLETEIPGQLRGADTVVERLDDAAFDANGVARTRVRLRALSLVSIAPIKTSCGAFHVYITLAGPQQVTRMSIYRTHENGGSFLAPIKGSARIAFVPVKGQSSRRLKITAPFTFKAEAIPWSLTGRPATKGIGSVFLDTNGDLVPDTLLPGTSNFAAGWSPRGNAAPKSCTLCEPEWCHPDESKPHCTGPVYACYPEQCP